jgi:hypothetical protein
MHGPEAAPARTEAVAALSLAHSAAEAVHIRSQIDRLKDS